VPGQAGTVIVVGGPTRSGEALVPRACQRKFAALKLTCVTVAREGEIAAVGVVVGIDAHRLRLALPLVESRRQRRDGQLRREVACGGARALRPSRGCRRRAVTDETR